MKTYRTDFRSSSLNESLELIRAERELILNDTVDKLNPIRWGLLSDAKKAEWTTFRTQLLNITQRIARVDYVEWPQVPSDKDETVVETPTETP